MISTNGRLVAGIHTTARALRIVVCEADTGAVVREARAAHPGGEPSEPAATGVAAGVVPTGWLRAFGEAADGGLLDGVDAVAVAAQGHGLVALDAAGTVVAPVPADDDVTASGAAADLVDTLGGPAAWVAATGWVPAAQSPVAHLRRLAVCEPETAARIASCLLPQDWLTWQLLGRPEEHSTERAGASTTGWWSPATESWRPDLLELALATPDAGRPVGGPVPSSLQPVPTPRLPRLLAPGAAAGLSPEGVTVAAGTDARAAVALGLGLEPGEAVVVLGSSCTVFCVHQAPVDDPSGLVSGLADASGAWLPLVRTRLGVRVLRGAARLLGLQAEEFDALALGATPGACGLVMLPYLDGERTPQLPDAAGTLAGLHEESMTRESFARAAVEGMLCGLADAVDVLRACRVPVKRLLLIGPGARSEAVRALAPSLLGVPVGVLRPRESARVAAVGAARQAAWARSQTASPPAWASPERVVRDPGDDRAVGAAVRHQFLEVRGRIHPEADPAWAR